MTNADKHPPGTWCRLCRIRLGDFLLGLPFYRPRPGLSTMLESRERHVLTHRARRYHDGRTLHKHFSCPTLHHRTDNYIAFLAQSILPSCIGGRVLSCDFIPHNTFSLSFTLSKCRRCVAPRLCEWLACTTLPARFCTTRESRLHSAFFLFCFVPRCPWLQEMQCRLAISTIPRDSSFSPHHLDISTLFTPLCLLFHKL